MTRKPELIDPLDYLIIQKMEDEGTLFAEMYPLGTTVKELTRQMKPISGAQINGRMRVLQLWGYAKKVNLGSVTAWQRTKEGKRVLDKWVASRGA